MLSIEYGPGIGPSASTSAEKYTSGLTTPSSPLDRRPATKIDRGRNLTVRPRSPDAGLRRLAEVLVGRRERQHDGHADVDEQVDRADDVGDGEVPARDEGRRAHAAQAGQRAEAGRGDQAADAGDDGQAGHHPGDDPGDVVALEVEER